MNKENEGKVQCHNCGRIGNAKIHVSWCPHCNTPTLGAYIQTKPEPIKNADSHTHNT